MHLNLCDGTYVKPAASYGQFGGALTFSQYIWNLHTLRSQALCHAHSPSTAHPRVRLRKL